MKYHIFQAGRPVLPVLLLLLILIVSTVSCSSAAGIPESSDGMPHVGYTMGQCRSLWGVPDHKSSSAISKTKNLKQWAYPDKGYYLYFVDGILYDIVDMSIPTNSKSAK